MLLRSALVLLSGLLLSRQQVDSVLRAIGRADGAAPALVHIVVHLAVFILVERAEVSNLRALAAVDALVLVPVDLPVGFGIDQAGAGLIGHLHREAAQTVAVADEAVLAVLHEAAGVELAHLLFHVLRADGLAHAAVDRAVRPVVHVDAHIELAVVEILLALAVAGHKMDAAVMPVDDLIELLERQIRLVVDIDALTGDLGLHLRQIDRLINLCLPVVERLDELSRQTAELIVLKLRIVGIAAVEVADLPGRLVRIRDLVEHVAGVHAVDSYFIIMLRRRIIVESAAHRRPLRHTDSTLFSTVT